MKYFIVGLFIGIASFIPGISGGTILYLSGEFTNFTKHLENFRQDYPYLIQLIIGGFVGIITFAKVMEFCFLSFPYSTKIFLAFLVLLSLPTFYHQQKFKFHLFPFLFGFISLLWLAKLVPSTPTVITHFPRLSLPFLAFLALCGSLDGFITIIPGISGSMIMMILGPYYLYKSISANVLNKPLLIIPLISYFIGDFTGIWLGSKFTTKIMQKYHHFCHSLIWGFIMSSLIILLPWNHLISLNTLILFLIAYLLSKLLIKN